MAHRSFNWSKAMNIQRTHDKSVYLGPDAPVAVKQCYADVADKILSVSPRSILDVGCATGDFMRYLEGRFPMAQVAGLEPEPSLAAEASSRGLYVGNAGVKGCFSADVITMLGVHGLFDTVEEWLEPLTRPYSRQILVF